MFKKLKIYLALFLLKKEENIMAVIYASLIVKGKKTIGEVPVKIREQVRQILIDLEVPEELYTEEA